MPEPHVYAALDRPDVEVLVDGQWCPGEARMRTELPGRGHRYNVQWHRDGSTYLDDFEGDQVRLVERGPCGRSLKPKDLELGPSRPGIFQAGWCAVSRALGERSPHATVDYGAVPVAMGGVFTPAGVALEASVCPNEASPTVTVA